jgi:hypothetical protein
LEQNKFQEFSSGTEIDSHVLFSYHTRSYINQNFCVVSYYFTLTSQPINFIEMLLSDHRMVEGQPLHYYYYHPYPELPFTCYSTFKTMEMREELMMPHSPNSTQVRASTSTSPQLFSFRFRLQSDSDNSLSSIEVSPKPIRARTVIQHTPKTNEVRCCWKSCGILFESLDQLATHVTRVHASSGPGGLFYCGWEGCSRNSKGFNARYKMLVHVRTHTNEKPHQCFQCDKSFSRAENLKIHSRSHSGEKPYVCPVPGCNKAYSNSSDRFKHTRTHQVEKPYQCKVPGCPKRYTDPSSLRKHVKTYKHFVHENNKVNDENVKSNSCVDRKLEGEKGHDKVNENHSCDCTHMCCVSGGNKTNEILRFGALINFRREEKCTTWNPFFSPDHQENILVSYNVHPDDNMDIDVPLDLSINRKVM